MYIGGEVDAVRAAVVCVLALHPVGCHFYRLLLNEDRYSAVLNTRGHCSLKGLGHCLRLGIGSHIPVFRTPAQEEIADTSADDKGIIAFVVKTIQHVLNIFGYHAVGEELAQY